METIIKNAAKRFGEKIFCNACGISADLNWFFPHKCVHPGIAYGYEFVKSFMFTVSRRQDGELMVWGD